MTRSRRIKATLLSGALLAVGSLVAAQGAAAVAFTVSNNADSGAGSLRAAITSANASGGTDEINFNIDGQTIALASPLPVITQPALISGCSNQLTAAQPCVEIRGSSTAETILSIASNADGSVVRSIAFTHGLIGLGSSADFLVAATNRFGIGLDGSASEEDDFLTFGLQTIGDDAIVGAVTDVARERNVFGNLTVGLNIGGNGTDVRGNYFGTDPSGVSPLFIRVGIGAVLNLPGFEPSDVTIGGTVPVPGQCGGFCNVLANAGPDAEAGGIVMPGTDGLTVMGNFIGLAADGAPLPDQTGINSDNSDNVTIGGATPAQANHIVSERRGVDANGAGTGAENVTVQGNLIGLSADGSTAIAPANPSGLGIQTETVDGALVSGNRIALPGQTAIEVEGGGSEVFLNTIGVGSTGAAVPGGELGIEIAISDGAEVAGNTVGNTGEAAIQLRGGAGNSVDANLLGLDGSGLPHPNDGVGISISGSVDNAVGSSNVISNSASNAIEIADGFDGTSTGNAVLGSSGTANGGLWIDLNGDGPGNPSEDTNEGIQPPSIDSASATGASGGGVPGDTIRVYGKQTAQPGEVIGVIGEATVAGDGSWSVTYSDPPAAALPIGATATRAGAGTSELALFGLPSPSTPQPAGPGSIAVTPPPTFTPPASTPARKCKKRKGKGAKPSARKCKTRRKR